MSQVEASVSTGHKFGSSATRSPRYFKGLLLEAIIAGALFAAGVMVVVPSIAGATDPGLTFYVNSATDTGATSSTCQSEANTTCGIDDAIAAFNADTTARLDTIRVGAGTFKVTSATSINNPTTGASLAIQGATAATSFLSGENTARVLTILASQTVTVSNLTIKMGKAANGDAGAAGGSGGGISNAGTLTVRDSTISGNAAGDGGANSSTGAGGAGGSGGGISSSGSLTLTNVIVSGNITGTGGTGGNGGAGATTGSYGGPGGTGGNGGAGGKGGGISSTGTLTMTNVTVSGNSVANGGTGGNGGRGGAGTSGPNTGGTGGQGGTGGHGGGINIASNSTLTNVTVSGNSAGSAGTSGTNGLPGTAGGSASSAAGNRGATGSYGGSAGGIYSAVGASVTVTMSGVTVSGNTGGNGAKGGTGGTGGSTTGSSAGAKGGNGGTGGSNGGGGIAHTGTGTLNISNSTIALNNAGSAGAGGDAGTAGRSGTGTAAANASAGTAGSANSPSSIQKSTTLRLAATILAKGSVGANCSGTPTDYGYNIADDTSCSFVGGTSISTLYSESTLRLGSLASNGGVTQTILPAANSSAVALIPADPSSQIVPVCPRVDQNGTQSVGSCTVGAVEVIPGSPTGVAATRGVASASVAFTAPASTGGSDITGYTVTATDTTTPANGGQTATGSSSPISVSGLTAGDSYTFTVKATNANGTGANSVASAAYQYQARPGAPGSFTGAPSGTSNKSSVTVGFTLGESGGTVVCRLDTGAWGDCTSVSGTAGTFAVSGLSDASHTVSVRQTDAVGNVSTVGTTSSWTKATMSPTAALLDSGSAGVGKGSTIKGSGYSVAGASGSPSAVFAWERCTVLDDATSCGAISGESGASGAWWGVRDADIGYQVRLKTSWTTLESVSSVAYSALSGLIAPVSSSAPVLAFGGSNSHPVKGTSVRSSFGVWAGYVGGVSTVDFQWQRCTSSSDATTCSDISSKTGQWYTPTTSDTGKFLRVRATLTTRGQSVTAYSVVSGASTNTALGRRAGKRVERRDVAHGAGKRSLRASGTAV